MHISLGKRQSKRKKKYCRRGITQFEFHIDFAQTLENIFDFFIRREPFTISTFGARFSTEIIIYSDITYSSGSSHITFDKCVYSIRWYIEYAVDVRVRQPNDEESVN